MTTISEVPRETSISARSANEAHTARNAAALRSSQSETNGPTAPSCMGDSKRGQAVQLAQELGSSSPWSESFIGRADSIPSASSAHRNTDSTHPEHPSRVLGDAPMAHRDLDPPPAYSRAPEIHELPADTTVQAMAQRHGSSQANAMQCPNRATDPQQELSEQTAAADVESPLLGHSQSSCRRHRWSRWHKRDPMSRRRRFRFLCLMILFAVLVSVLVSGLVDAFISSTWRSREPSQPRQSLVPTGPEYERHETIENIKGSYELYDRIDLSTTTGSIDIEIDPQPGEGPAYLFLSSDLGSITLRLSPSYIHRNHHVRRPIYTEIRSFTGSVAADILLGSGGNALVDTSTGVQFLSVMAYDLGPSDAVSNLTTRTETGSQSVQLTSLDQSHKLITNLRAEHHSYATASLNIVYPSTWMGEIFALTSEIGPLEVVGDHLSYTKQKSHKVIAHRGSTRHRVNVISDGTGSVNFKC